MKADVLLALAELRDGVPSLRSLTFGVDLGLSSKNWDLVLVGEFESQEALQAYMVHPLLQRVAAVIASATQHDAAARIQYSVDG